MAALKKAAAKKTTAKKTTAKAPAGKNKSAADVDDILGGGEDDVLAGKGKKGAAKKASGKAAAKAPRAASGSTEKVRAILAKTKKPTSYSDIAEANDFNIRMVRRTARSMRDAGEIELMKEGTVVYVQPVGRGKK